jgi:2-keto-3-deoxygluconate permease
MVSCNPGLYLALVDQYGDKTDAVSFGLFSAICAPGYAVTIVGASSGIAEPGDVQDLDSPHVR